MSPFPRKQAHGPNRFYTHMDPHYLDYGIQTQTVRVQRCEVRRLRPEERVNSPSAQMPLEITRTVYTM